MLSKFTLTIILTLILTVNVYGNEPNLIRKFDGKLELKVMRIIPGNYSFERNRKWVHCTIYSGRHICKRYPIKRNTIIVTDKYWQVDL